MPQKIFIKRLDTQLNMWILEAKNFPAKKKCVKILYSNAFVSSIDLHCVVISLHLYCIMLMILASCFFYKIGYLTSNYS